MHPCVTQELMEGIITIDLQKEASLATAKLIHFDSVEHEERRPGVILTSLVDQRSGSTQISSGIAEFAVGASAPTHYHNAEETVIVFSSPAFGFHPWISSPRY